jgi:virginiamycin B lyase
MARQVPPTGNQVKVRGLFARFAVFGAAFFLIAGSVVGIVAGSAIGNRMPAALASSLSSVTDSSVPGIDPWGTAFDSSGRVWVALPGCDGTACSSSSAPGKLALFNPATSAWAMVVTLPAGYGQPLFVAVDHSGKVWFTMPATNSIGVYDPVSAAVTQWAVPTTGAGPWDIAIDSTGMIWLTEHYVNKIASFNPVTTTFQEVATPDTNSNPYGIAIDSSNNVWFTENTDAVASVDEYTTAGVLEQFKVRNTSTAGIGLTPHMIVIASNGTVWWSEGFFGAIASLNVAAAQPGTNSGVTEYFYPRTCNNCGTHTSGISVDGQGNIWWDDSLQSIFGSFPVGGGTFSEFGTPTANSHPHDGLNVDSQNRIWFDEEFANKLAEAVQSGSTASPSPTTTSPSPTPTTSTPPASSLGTDTFHRANQALWGAASDGQSWGGDANTASVFSVSGNAGLVTNTGGTSYSAVLGPSATDSEVIATGSLSSFNSSNFGDVLRWTDGNDWYKAYLDGANLVIQKKVAGSATVLATTPLAATAGVSYTIHFRVVGSTLTANAWPSSASEPPGWMVTTTDTSLASGRAGMRFLTQGGTATITAFQANQV